MLPVIPKGKLPKVHYDVYTYKFVVDYGIEGLALTGKLGFLKNKKKNIIKIITYF